MEDEEKLKKAAENTRILRYPSHHLDTFSETKIEYYILTHPVYDDDRQEVVIRTGNVTASRPQILSKSEVPLPQGFSDEADKLLEALNIPIAGFKFSYTNEPGEMKIVSGSISEIANQISCDIDNKGSKSSVIISGDDAFWDVSLMKFIVDFTQGSLMSNFKDLSDKHLIDVDSNGVPRLARMLVEAQFKEVQDGKLEPETLKNELDRWHLFEEYESRFYSLFR